MLTPDEIALPFGGDVELEDLETGRRVITSAAARERLPARPSPRFLERWRTTCASYGIDYHRVTTDMPLDASLRDYLRRRTRSDHR